ncbi:MAG: type IV pilus assembly protein PilM [Gemmatales bacterium]|nr:type IV pilus assembly protein PilM [Gemmatales bacterium]MDW8222866.1 type IV pilus assembly protein PilM [Gemmatales bacterium]
MPAKPTGVWGIDVGQCSFKALRLENRNGEVVATAFDFIEYPKMLGQPDADPDALVREALERFLSRNKVKGDLVAIAAPGQTGLARFVKLPPVEEKKIPDIVRFEAKQQIPFPLDEVVWDWQTTRRSEVAEGFVENEIGLFALKRDVVFKALQVFRDLKVEVHLVQMTPLALLNLAVYDLLGRTGAADEAPPEPDRDGKVPCLVVLDMGTDSSNLVITDGYRIIWQRPVPVGGNHFTRVLSKDFKLTFAKAEHLKRNATKAEDPRKVFQSLRAVFTDFAGEVSRSLGYFSSQYRDAKVERIVGLGNGFRLPGMQKFLEQSLEVPVERLSEYQKLKGEEVTKAPTFFENVLTFGVAYGLALQGLELSKVRTNLLPPELHRERFIRAKKPWLAAAAAALLTGVTVYAISAADKLAKAQELKTREPEIDRVLRESQDLERQANQEREETLRALAAAEDIVRGNRERANWVLLHTFLNHCLPQPNGQNIPPQFLGKYWDTPRREAQLAYLRQRQLEERDQRYRLDRRHLLEINLQAAWCRYVSAQEAEAALNRVYNENTYGSDQFRNQPDWQVTEAQPPRLANPPRKDGWLIELHAFTYHDKGVEFILDTLVYNLRDASKRQLPLPRDAQEMARLLRNLLAVERTREASPAGGGAPLVPGQPPMGPGKPPMAKPNPAETAASHPATTPTTPMLEVGYVALFQHRVDIVAQHQTKPFYKIGRQIWLNGLLRGAGGGEIGGGMPRPFPGGGGGSAPGGEGGLGPDVGGAGGRRGQDWLGLGRPIGGGVLSGAGGDAGPPGRPGSGGEPPPEKDAATRDLRPGELRRTEVVIIFYWHEPRPTEATAQGSPPGPAKPGGPFGSGSPSGAPGPAGGGAPPPPPAQQPKPPPGPGGRFPNIE